MTPRSDDALPGAIGGPGLFPAIQATAEAPRMASLAAYGQAAGRDLGLLPRSIRILLEAALVHAGRNARSLDMADAIAAWRPGLQGRGDIAFPIGRVLLQDAAGLPVLADFAAVRDAAAARGIDPVGIAPAVPVALVVDHSIIIERAGSGEALSRNMALEFERNRERFSFLKWAGQAFPELEIVPPGNGIIHQMHLERIARVAIVRDGWISCDSVIGTDSHTTMVNGLGVLGWGVGGIEALDALLGDVLTLAVPEVIGVRLAGAPPAGVMATDLALILTERLRREGVTGSFLEFFGHGLDALSVEDRATLSNMAPEYGATLALFPVDERVLAYLAATGRPPEQIALVKAHLERQGLFGQTGSEHVLYDRMIELDLATARPSLAGPSRPDQRVELPDLPRAFAVAFPEASGKLHGKLVLAAITSCTNTANPRAMIAAGLLAKAAAEAGLTVDPLVQTSFAPGSRAVPAYLERAWLMQPLIQLGFAVAAYGCAVCVGNTGPLAPAVEALLDNSGVPAVILSGNRNFEARIHPRIKAAYLASPALVVAYALAGRIDTDLTREPIGRSDDGRAIHLRDLWPSEAAITAALSLATDRSAATLLTPEWDALELAHGPLFPWDAGSTFLRPPPFTERAPAPFGTIEAARPLLVLGDSITTDHISPVGPIGASSPAAQYLAGLGVARAEFGTYAARRVNHEVMIRGTFANARLRNLLVPGREGPQTRLFPFGTHTGLYEAAERYRESGTPLVVIAGKNYGAGSARDWAAKGTALLGIRAVLAESFERIHRSNLVRLGVAPIEVPQAARLAERAAALPDFSLDILVEGPLRARMPVMVRVGGAEEFENFTAILRADTSTEAALLSVGGLFPQILKTRLREPNC